jgi:hypothetical protein
VQTLLANGGHGSVRFQVGEIHHLRADEAPLQVAVNGPGCLERRGSSGSRVDVSEEEAGPTNPIEGLIAKMFRKRLTKAEG